MAWRKGTSVEAVAAAILDSQVAGAACHSFVFRPKAGSGRDRAPSPSGHLSTSLCPNSDSVASRVA